MTESNNWYVYIMECSDKSLYCGVTTDLSRREREHNQSKIGARYTRSRRPVKIVYYENAETRSEACRREWEIKKLSKQQKNQLIKSD